MHDESLEPRAYAKLHADRYLWQEQQERAALWQEMALGLEWEAQKALERMKSYEPETDDAWARRLGADLARFAD
jgi:hypothetical protein